MSEHPRSLTTLVILGPLPPPVHGQSKNTKILVDDLHGRCDLRIADLSAGSLERGIRYHLRKITRIANAIGTILRASTARDRRIYIATDGGLGLIYNLIFVSLGRILGFRLFLHHRSFSFVDRKMPLMAAVAGVAGRRANHIFLCPAMAERYRLHYPSAVRTRVVSNAMHVNAHIESSPTTDLRPGRLSIGLLSNLGPEKGLVDFLELIRECSAGGLPVRGVLAGPPSSEESAELIAGAEAELGDRLEYRGAIYGQAKEEFFRDIDIFVFPTRYPVEAQPNVLFEAMSFGVPVISYGRGCVATELQDSGMVVIPTEEDFISNALPALSYLLEEVRALTDARRAALDFVSKLGAEARVQYDELLEDLSC